MWNPGAHEGDGSPRTLATMRNSMRMSSAALSLPPPDVAYLTDIEGNWEYFLAAVDATRALSRSAERADGTVELELADGWHCVFGGGLHFGAGSPPSSSLPPAAPRRARSAAGERVMYATL